MRNEQIAIGTVVVYPAAAWQTMANGLIITSVAMPT